MLCPLARHINPSLVLVQPRKIRPFISERLLMGRKASNQTNKNHVIAHFMLHVYIYPYLSRLTLPPFIFQADIYIYLFFHVVMRADAFIKYIFSTTELTVYLYEKKEISTI